MVLMKYPEDVWLAEGSFCVYVLDFFLCEKIGVWNRTDNKL
jgi:hypothetical protein